MESKNIARLIQTIAKKGVRINDAIVGTVIEGSVDTAKGLCDVQPLNEDAKIVGVKLRTQQSKTEGTVEDFLVLAPVEGSQVIVSFTSAGQGFISMYSEIKQVKFILNEGNLILDINETAATIKAASGDINFKLDDAEVLIDANGITLKVDESEIALNGTGNAGLVKVIELTSRLNSIESAINTLVSEFNAHIHPTPAGPSSAPTVPSTANPGSTTQSGIENPIVKHGE